MNTLQKFRDRFNEINGGLEAIKMRRLEMLKNDMESTFDIPGIFDSTYASNNPAVMRLYHQVIREGRML